MIDFIRLNHTALKNINVLKPLHNGNVGPLTRQREMEQQRFVPTRRALFNPLYHKAMRFLTGSKPKEGDKIKRFTVCLVVLAVVFAMAGRANASLIGVTGPNSSAGIAPAIIAAPPYSLDDIMTNWGMKGFDEIQGFITTVAHVTDSGSIAAGTYVDSHMIFLNSPGLSVLQHHNVVWTFSGAILGVMSDQHGNLEANSTFELGSPGTNYTVPISGSGPAAPFPARGMENNDWYTLLSPNTLQVNMWVTEPGDWIRVVTEDETIPEPGTLLLLSSGLAGLMGYGKLRIRRKKRA